MVNDETRNKSTYYIIKRYGSFEPSKVTVISIYFHLNRSKHHNGFYKPWLKNFFQSVTSPLVIFTDKNYIEDLLILRNKFHLPTTLYITRSIWSVMKENEMKRNRTYTFNYQNKLQSLDREKHIHNPNLYAIWNLKTFISDKLAEDNFYKSSAFIFTDSGAWREGIFENWPDQNFIMNLTNILDDKILLGQIDNETIMLKQANFPDVDLIQGGFFLGSQKAMHNFHEDFWKIHDLNFDRGLFCGKEQVTMNFYAYNMSNNVKLDIIRRNCTKNINRNFFYQNYFASEKYYPCYGKRESLLSIKREK